MLNILVKQDLRLEKLIKKKKNYCLTSNKIIFFFIQQDADYCSLVCFFAIYLVVLLDLLSLNKNAYLALALTLTNTNKHTTCAPK